MQALAGGTTTCGLGRNSTLFPVCLGKAVRHVGFELGRRQSTHGYERGTNKAIEVSETTLISEVVGRELTREDHGSPRRSDVVSVERARKFPSVLGSSSPRCTWSGIRAEPRRSSSPGAPDDSRPIQPSRTDPWHLRL